jgi:hypothetical protein
MAVSRSKAGKYRRALAVLLLYTLASCADDRVRLSRGPLGPAHYRVALDVSGRRGLPAEDVTATMHVENTAGGAKLRLAVSGDEPIVAQFHRTETGQLALDTVQNVPPSSAGEADLAALVGQLDPPLPAGPVRLRRSWSSTRRIATETIAAVLTSRLRIVRFRRVADADAAELVGTVRGRLKTSGTSGVFDGAVEGTTTIAWAMDPGRVAASSTRLVWTIPGAGRLVVETSVRPL